MNRSKPSMSTKIEIPRPTSTLRRKLRMLVPLLALSGAACDGVDELDHAEPELDDSELRDELAAAPEAGEPTPSEDSADPGAPGPDGPDILRAAPTDPLAVKHNLCCELRFVPPFQVYLDLRNPGPTFLEDCSSIFAADHSTTYKITHHYGNPGIFTGVTAPLPLGSKRSIELTHSGAMNAVSCEAFFET